MLRYITTVIFNKLVDNCGIQLYLKIALKKDHCFLLFLLQLVLLYTCLAGYSWVGSWCTCFLVLFIYLFMVSCVTHGNFFTSHTAEAWLFIPQSYNPETESLHALQACAFFMEQAAVTHQKGKKSYGITFPFYFQLLSFTFLTFNMQVPSLLSPVCSFQHVLESQSSLMNKHISKCLMICCWDDNENLDIYILCG